jgi:outer membrane protein OmpA-like peptidoglycan-associated protein
LLFTSFDVRAQTYTESFAARIQGGVLATFHSASFSSTRDVIDCGGYGRGVGLGPIFNAIAEIPFSHTLGMGIGVGYADRSVTFTRTNTYPIRDTVTLQDGTMTTTVSHASTLSYLEFQPDVRIALIGNYSERILGLSIGPRIALPLTSNFKQSEEIVSPDSAVFISNGQRTQERTIKEASYTTTSKVLYGLSAGVETLIKVNQKTSIVPSLAFDMYFTNLLTDASWTTWGIRAEVGIRYSIGSSALHEDMPPAVPPPPPLIAYTPVAIATTSSAFVGEIVTGNQLYATKPIVNAVFFDSASAEIPPSYRRAKDSSKSGSDPVEAHSWVLVRIADIMARNPAATIVLEGATSGPAAEPEGIILAQKRTQSVHSVLIKLGVEEHRIQTSAHVFPQVVSNNDLEGGREENRRVDLIVHNAPLQEWVSTQRFAELRGQMTLGAVQVGGDPTMRDSASIHVASRFIDTTIRGSRVNLVVPVRAPIPGEGDTVHVQFALSSSGAYTTFDTVISTGSLTQRQIDLQTDDFEAILRFDYNSSELTADVKDLLQQLVGRLPQGSTINILGSTDILGSEARNRMLSEMRATNTMEFIRSISGSDFTINTSQLRNNVAEGVSRFSDSTPQGRFLNRSIRVRVYTPN